MVSAQRVIPIILILATAVVFPAAILAGPSYLRGSWSTELYGYDNGKSSHWDPYINLRLNFTKPIGQTNRFWGLRLDSRAAEERVIAGWNGHLERFTSGGAD